METQLFQPKHKFNFTFDKHIPKTIFADTKKYRYFHKTDCVGLFRASLRREENLASLTTDLRSCFKLCWISATTKGS